MSKMTPHEYQQLIDLLDGRIDVLTKPIPSQQIRRFAEAIRSAELGDEDNVGTTFEIPEEGFPVFLREHRDFDRTPENGKESRT